MDSNTGHKVPRP